MLTDAEKEACRNATFTKGRHHGYGSPEEGMCPIGAVAVLRGAVPYLYDGTHEYTFLDFVQHDSGVGGYYVSRTNDFIADQARRDILGWVGFPCTHKGFCTFLDMLQSHGTSLFSNLP